MLHLPGTSNDDREDLSQTLVSKDFSAVFVMTVASYFAVNGCKYPDFVNKMQQNCGCTFITISNRFSFRCPVCSNPGGSNNSELVHTIRWQTSQTLSFHEISHLLPFEGTLNVRRNNFFEYLPSVSLHVTPLLSWCQVRSAGSTKGKWIEMLKRRKASFLTANTMYGLPFVFFFFFYYLFFRVKRIRLCS